MNIKSLSTILTLITVCGIGYGSFLFGYYIYEHLTNVDTHVKVLVFVICIVAVFSGTLELVRKILDGLTWLLEKALQ